MGLPTREEARELSEWQPPLGVVSVYLGFDPADRSDAWRTLLRNGVERILSLADGDGHERKLAVRTTAERLLERFEPREVRPPPRGEVGFLEVSRNGGRECWWGMGVAPVVPGVAYGERPAMTELVDLCGRCEAVGVALLSTERVRLLRFVEGELEDLAGWELSILSLAWRERKAQSSRDPARVQGVGSSGHDQYGERLEHNRRRFLRESGRLARERLQKLGVGEIVVFGPASDLEAFRADLDPSGIRTEAGGEAELISAPTKEVLAAVSAAIERLTAANECEVVEQALARARSRGRGATGVEDTLEALTERRVEHVVLSPAAGEPAEALVRGALAGDAKITIAHDGNAELLAPAGGVAAILRY